MGVYRRPDSPYWWIDYVDAEGKRRRESTGVRSKKAASEVLDRKRYEAAIGKVSPRAVRFHELSRRWWRAHGSKLATHGLEGNRRRWDECFGSLWAHRITTEQVEAFLDKLAPVSRNRNLHQLQAVFNWGLKRRYVHQNPCGPIRKTPEVSRTRWLTREETERLLEACRRNRSPHLYPAVLLAVRTGMRLGEILNLRWEDVDFKSRTIHVPMPKERKPKSIPVPEPVMAVLAGLPSRFREWVFPGKSGPVQTLRTSFASALKEAGIDNFRFHDLRHTFASHLVLRGVPLNTVGELLGHSDPRLTRRYAHLSDEAKRRAVQELNGD